MKKILSTILVLAAVLAAASAAEEELGGRLLEGEVVAGTGSDPVPFASVTVARLDGGRAAWTAVTDAGGRFQLTIPNVPGTWRVTVRARGYHEVRDGLRLGPEAGPVRLRVTLGDSRAARPEGPMLALVEPSAGVIVLAASELDRIASERGIREQTPVPAGIGEPDDAADGPGPVGRARIDGDGRIVPIPESQAPRDRGTPDTREEKAELRQQGVQTPITNFDRAGRNASAMGRVAVGALDDESLAQLTRGTDELWILERPGARRPVPEDDGPGTGCLVVIDEGAEIPVPLEHTDVHARIDGYVASVEVRQRFHNPFEETIEAEYLFPLPHDAAVNDFLMIVGDRRIRGIIREKEEARQIYERARAAGHVATLLEQERPNIFRQRVANIEPGHTIEVELHYFNALPYRDGEFEFAFPLVIGPRFNPPQGADPIGAVPRGARPTGGTSVSYLAPGERSGHDVDITVELDAGVKLEQVRSQTHAARVRRTGASRALIELAPHDRIPNKDFVLNWRVAGDAIRPAVLVHREGGEGYFSMMLVPPASLESVERAPVEFVFVLDCSGSMNGWPMEKSKSAMRRALRQLRPGDSFQIVRFSESASALGPVPIEATAENVARGIAYVDGLHGGGGTMMIEGIKAALDFPHDPARSRVVSFMTDGFIGNEDEIFAEVAERLGTTRIFSFGVGSSVNRHLIEGLARMGRGAVAYVGLDDDLGAVDDFYRIVRHPAMTDLTIDWGSMRAHQVFPQRVGDLFVGRPVLLHGRYEGSGSTTVTVRGRAGGQEVVLRIDVDLDRGADRRALPLLWARGEIQHIADRLVVELDESLQARGRDLALAWNLVSDWTSFVAVDASAVVDAPGTRTETVPVPVPEGVDYDTTVKENGR